MISFSGSATDPEEGTLPASRLTWSLLIQHCPSNCHTHPVQDFVGVASGSFSAQDHEYPSHLELRLTATDSFGLQGSASVLLYPKTVGLSFTSNPSGTAAFRRQHQPGDAVHTHGDHRLHQLDQRPLSADAREARRTSSRAWSDLGAQSHNIIAPATAKTYSATYGRPPAAGRASTSARVGIDGQRDRRVRKLHREWLGVGHLVRSDQFHFVYRQLSGDGQIVARVASVREHERLRQGRSDDPARVSPPTRRTRTWSRRRADGSSGFQRRLTPGANDGRHDGGGPAAPQWVRLTQRQPRSRLRGPTTEPTGSTIGTTTINSRATSTLDWPSRPTTTPWTARRSSTASRPRSPRL